MGMTDIVGPSIIRLKDGKYRMYLQGHNQMGVNIISLISNDGSVWTPEPGIRIKHGFESDLDFEAGEPDVFLGLDGKFYMAYTGRQPVTNNLYHKILFAVSDDGLNWTKLNKAFSDPLNMNSFAASADVLSVNDIYIMYYTGGTTILKATSDDGLNWSRQSVVFDVGHDSTTALLDGNYYMFAKIPLASKNPKSANAADETDNDAILMAISADDAILMTVSPDGLNWPQSYYRITVKDVSGAEIAYNNLQNPAAAVMGGSSLTLYLNTLGGASIISARPTTPLPK